MGLTDFIVAVLVVGSIASSIGLLIAALRGHLWRGVFKVITDPAKTRVAGYICFLYIGIAGIFILIGWLLDSLWNNETWMFWAIVLAPLVGFGSILAAVVGSSRYLRRGGRDSGVRT